MVQVSERVASAMNGSMKAVAGSGMASMSEASMDFQPRMEEPSKPRPSLKESSFNSLKGRVKCCQVPKVSTNFTSTILAPAFLAISNTCLGRSEEHTSELQSLAYLVCRLLLEKKK